MNLPYPSRQKLLFMLAAISAAMIVVGIGIVAAASRNSSPIAPEVGTQIDYVNTQAYADAACEFMAMKALSFHPREPKITIKANYEAVVYCFEPETNLTARSLIPLIKK